jgi:hypothetical protein
MRDSNYRSGGDGGFITPDANHLNLFAKATGS